MPLKVNWSKMHLSLASVVSFLVLTGTGRTFEIEPVSINAEISSFGLGAVTRPRDCADVEESSYRENGVYTVYVGAQLKPVQVYCDLENDGGGWMVFQRREDGYENFRRPWNDYARGFGDLYGEFWLGNHVLHLVTNQKDYMLRIDLADFTNQTRYAEYTTFKVDAPFQKYRLHVTGFTGNEGNAMATHNEQRFSTIDQDNDRHSGSCSDMFNGGWWYNACHAANLNGYYYGGPHTSYADGVDWRTWPGYADYSLRFTQLKIRPADYQPRAQDEN